MNTLPQSAREYLRLRVEGAEQLPELSEADRYLILIWLDRESRRTLTDVLKAR